MKNKKEFQKKSSVKEKNQVQEENFWSIISQKKYKQAFKKSWDFLINADTPASWIANIVLALLIIKFVFYPVLFVIFNTNLPLVAVVSGSMEHKIISHNDQMPQLCGIISASTVHFVSRDLFWKNCGLWYEKNSISRNQFESFSFSRGFNKGDIMVINGVSPDSLKVGDVIVFRKVPNSEPIIHRIVMTYERDGKKYFLTKGDHNAGSGFIDIDIPAEAIEGKAVFRVPYLGWVKVWLTDFLMWFKSIF